VTEFRTSIVRSNFTLIFSNTFIMPYIGPVFNPVQRRRQTSFARAFSTSRARYGPVQRVTKRKLTAVRKVQRAFRSRRSGFKLGRRPTFETKYLPLSAQNEATPGAIQTGAKAYWKGFVIGAKPGSWGAGSTDLGGILCQKGVDANQRIGNYIYLNHTLINFNIDTKLNSDVAPPIEFRVIVFRQRREAMPAGINPDPNLTLFKNEAGVDVGHSTGGINGTDLMLQPLNREKWIIVRDQKFTLQKPDHGDHSFGNGGYKNMKNFRFNLGYKKKAHYESANVPTNVAYHYGLYVYARSLDKDHNASNWEVNLRGTTCYNDL